MGRLSGYHKAAGNHVMEALFSFGESDHNKASA